MPQEVILSGDALEKIIYIADKVDSLVSTVTEIHVLLYFLVVIGSAVLIVWFFLLRPIWKMFM
ncbi:hypothetical protein DCMF_05205 [Candidatus Formimonas warabiya]|uniref:Uncharacterized protein n=1 Tax=Formimonas warabiya TaxID=1761012 RepID=A0A3G1KP74_FORW1|nr:hypothetical protein DCMF_05205 [Candidatus Formimonas warabiya]